MSLVQIDTFIRDNVSPHVEKVVAEPEQARHPYTTKGIAEFKNMSKDKTDVISAFTNLCNSEF